MATLRRAPGPRSADASALLQTTVLPRRPRPVVCIGAGAVVREAHLPAYRLAQFPVAAIYDVVEERAQGVADAFGIPLVASSLAGAVRAAPLDAVFDVAVPARAVPDVLSQLPPGASVLIQKPMGEDLRQARAIRDLCRRRRLVAGVNFQLRFAPGLLAVRDLVERGDLGEIHDIDVRVTCHMPWERWTFLAGAPRMEIVFHSIHYVDLVRSFLGEPAGVYCKTVKDPKHTELASTRTVIALDYGDILRATVSTNHGHEFGPRHQESYVKVEGTAGAAKIRLGVNLDYPRGVPDELEFCRLSGEGPPEWTPVPLAGSWFPQAFIGPMASVMRCAEGETSEIPTSVEDAYRTMAVVEACYLSSQGGGTPVPS